MEEYKFQTMIAHKDNFGGTRPYSAIRYIVIHYTANDGDHDESNARYFQTAHKPASSAHYFVDDDSVTQSVPDHFIAYAVGGKKYTDTAATGGGRFYGIVTNANSLSIEMCDTKRDGKYQATEKTLANAAALCRKLMERYHIDIDHVVRHFDVTGKHCPVYLMDNAAWTKFKNRLRKDQKMFQTDQTYAAAYACYLRDSAGAKRTNRVDYNTLSSELKKKCRKKRGLAVFKRGKTFRLMEVKDVGQNVWGRMKSGYWVPLIYKGKKLVKLK